MSCGGPPEPPLGDLSEREGGGTKFLGASSTSIRSLARSARAMYLG